MYGRHFRAYASRDAGAYNLTDVQSEGLKRIGSDLARCRKLAGKRALELQEHMADLRAMADALWGDWRPRVR